MRVTPSRQRADEWAVVLAAADIPHWLRRRLDGWALVVPAREAAAALDSLDAYDRENPTESLERGEAATTSSRPVTLVGLGVALLLIGFFAITGTQAHRTAWFQHGSANATRILAGEWWRTVTALTLHADALHLLGNALAAALLVTAVCQQLGTGIGLWLLLLAGAGGNALTAVVHGPGHDAVGASTAVFGAIGILAGSRSVTRRRTGRWWIVAAASVVLLTLLGTGPKADLVAHAFGLLLGGGLGSVAALTIHRTPSAWVQWLLTGAAATFVAEAWRRAS